jgi:heat-inducible transcriptional repressor
MGNISESLQADIIKDMYDFKDILIIIIRNINKSINSRESVELYYNGITKIFNFPEYNDISKAKTFISFIENKDNVIKMLMNNGFDNMNTLGITIGEENSYDEIKNCSLITATYRINGKTIGKIGVIGPTRMEYSKVIPLVQSISLDLSRILNQYFE